MKQILKTGINNMTIDKKYYLEGTEKVGDKVWSLQKFIETGNGECLIDEFWDKHEYQIKIDNNTYSYNRLGLFSTNDKIPSLFKSNPFIPEFPKMMEVSNDEITWDTTEIYHIKINDVLPFKGEFNYKYAREIKTKPKLSEILKEKGIDINNFENDLT